jgi:hypothetical protein
MGKTDNDLHGDSGVQDAQLNPRQGFFAEQYENKLKHTCQVWLRFQVEGEVRDGWCAWEEEYTEEEIGKVHGRQEAYLLLFRQIAHALNSGLSFWDIKKTIDDHPWTDLPVIELPDPWFYWASSFDYDGCDESAPVCTHYYVQPDSDQCLVWQEDTYMEIVPCESVGIHWVTAREAIATQFREEVEDAEEGFTPP